MTAIYNAADNTLTEQSDYDLPPDRPNIRNYSSSQQEMYQRHLDAWQAVMYGYNANKERYEKTLRTIPAHDSARSLWKDGQKVQEGKDYRIQLSCSGNFEVCERQFRCSDCTPIAFPLPVKSEPKLEMKDLPEPVGKFIIDQQDIKPLMMPNGAYYHYVDVIKMLVRYKDYSPAKP